MRRRPKRRRIPPIHPCFTAIDAASLTWPAAATVTVNFTATVGGLVPIITPTVNHGLSVVGLHAGRLTGAFTAGFPSPG